MDAQKKIVNNYVDALDEFVQVMPKFGQDTESEWAADTVHAMALALKQNRYSYQKSLAIISQMLNYTAYGMVYFNATIGAYKEPQLAGYALHLIPQSDSLYHNLEDTEFKDIRKLAVFQRHFLQHLSFFLSI
jgi:hypothetical protein